MKNLLLVSILFPLFVQAQHPSVFVIEGRVGISDGGSPTTKLDVTGKSAEFFKLKYTGKLAADTNLKLYTVPSFEPTRTIQITSDSTKLVLDFNHDSLNVTGDMKLSKAAKEFIRWCKLQLPSYETLEDQYIKWCKKNQVIVGWRYIHDEGKNKFDSTQTINFTEWAITSEIYKDPCKGSHLKSLIPFDDPDLVFQVWKRENGISNPKKDYIRVEPIKEPTNPTFEGFVNWKKSNTK